MAPRPAGRRWWVVVDDPDADGWFDPPADARKVAAEAVDNPPPAGAR
jgi:hypothetical protein